ncbi:unnamed protein product [Callosobruchus maculatus]|uniref:Uncharacterized protein n=1 Tax=Callosobruchus maculatus TaxID=64391 RepID=A0A653DJV4_CALMS|nr:unnamed protein product [Callosobruchus maculatus]
MRYRIAEQSWSSCIHTGSSSKRPKHRHAPWNRHHDTNGSSTMLDPSLKLRTPPQWPAGSSCSAQRRSLKVQNAIFWAVAKNAGRSSSYTHKELYKANAE